MIYESHIDLSNLSEPGISSKHVLEIYPDSVYVSKCAAKIAVSYADSDLEKYPELNEAIDKANSVVQKYFGTNFEIFKQLKSIGAVSKVKKIAKKFNVAEVNGKEPEKELGMY